MSTLIVTEPDDIHAVLVKLALEKKGEYCQLLFTADMPSIQKNNVYISTQACSWNSDYADGKVNYMLEDQFDSIWWRRPRRPSIPKYVHKDDALFVQKENGIYHDSIPFLLNQQAWWVNPISSHQKTLSKIIQLKFANQSGFQLPETLISNSPKDIRKFINLSDCESVIYKPFSPQFWLENNGMKMLYTDKVSLDDLPSDNMLQVVPGIYQRYIEKKYEVRVTCFGTHISAVKIDSQKHPHGQIDWRKIPGHELALSEIQLPQSLKDKIIVYMNKMGVVFGCFDFIVTPEDEFIFLEINEQGQFIWVEEILPRLCYLDIFSDFLMHKNFNYSWKKTNQSIIQSELNEDALRIVTHNIERHVYLNQVKSVA